MNAALILVVCLALSPGDCREERPLIHGLTLMSCMVLAQQHAAEFLRDRPGLVLSRWRCEIGARGRDA